MQKASYKAQNHIRIANAALLSQLKKAVFCFLLLLVAQSTVAQEKALFEAIQKADLESFKALLEKGVDINARDPEGNTTLHKTLSLKENNKINNEMARLLIEKGADVNAKNKYLRTFLYSVSDVPIAQLLISKRAN